MGSVETILEGLKCALFFGAGITFNGPNKLYPLAFATLAFGAMGVQVYLSLQKKEREDGD